MFNSWACGLTEIFNKKLVTIRTSHICHGCGEKYRAGHKMTRIAGKVDGQVLAVLYCLFCSDWLERHDWINPLELEAGHIREKTWRMSWRELDRVEGGA